MIAISILGIFLLFSAICLALYQRNFHKRLALEKQASIIAAVELNSNQPLLPSLSVQSNVGKHVLVDGHYCLNLATRNFLSVLEDTELLEDACKFLHPYGVGSYDLKGFYGKMDMYLHLYLEDRLAKFMRMDEAVVSSYGFSTIESAITSYAKRGDVIFVDEAVNFGIKKALDVCRSHVYYFQHNDMIDLESLLMEQQSRDEKDLKKATKTRRFLIVEGVYMNTGEICPLPKLVALRAKYRLRLFLEESISFGTLGDSGRGLTEYFNVHRTEVDLICASMEWASGTIGGFCVGSHFMVEHQRPSGLDCCFSVSLPPILTQAAISALNRFEREPKMFEELQRMTAMLHAKFNKFSKLVLGGNEISPVKHLYLANRLQSDDDERKLLTVITDECIMQGVATFVACYLRDIEKPHIRNSIRITSNRLLTIRDIDQAFAIIELVSNNIL